WRDVVVFDLVGDEAATDGAGCLVAVSAKPFAIGFHFRVGVDGRQRGGDPAGFQRVRRVSAGTHWTDAEFFARLQDRAADLFTFFVRSPDFETRCAGHAVTQRADGASGDLDLAHVEELDLRQRAAVQLLQDSPCVRTLDLVAIAAAHNR